MIVKRGIGILLLGGALAAPALGAQTADSVLAREVEGRREVRLRADGARVTGRLIALGGGLATLDTKAGRRAVPLAGVDTAWVRGRATSTGIIIGGIAGLVLMGTFVAIVADGVCEYECDNAASGGFLVGGLIGAAGGGLLGAAVGALIPKWKRRWP